MWRRQAPLLVFIGCCYASPEETYHRCVTFPANIIDPICVDLSLITCTDPSLQFDVTTGGIVQFNWTITDIADARKCYPEGDCTLCFEFDSLVIDSSHVSACPKIVQTCPVFGVPVPTTVKLDCLVLGTDCESLKTCGACTANRNCGWCGKSGTVGTCYANSLDAEGPLCDPCLQTWWHGSCPLNHGLSKGTMALALGVGIGGLALFLLCLIMYITLAYKRKTVSQPKYDRPDGDPLTTGLTPSDQINYEPPAPLSSSGSISS